MVIKAVIRFIVKLAMQSGTLAECDQPDARVFSCGLPVLPGFDRLLGERVAATYPASHEENGTAGSP